jgi:hypothetical protein
LAVASAINGLLLAGVGRNTSRQTVCAAVWWVAGRLVIDNDDKEASGWRQWRASPVSATARLTYRNDVLLRL